MSLYMCECGKCIGKDAFFGFYKLNVEDVAKQYIQNWENEGETYIPANGCICLCDEKTQMWIMNGDWYCSMYVDDEETAHNELNVAYSSIGIDYGWEHATVIAYNEGVVFAE